MMYRTHLNASLKAAQHVDKLERHVARSVIKLPYGTPKDLFHGHAQGIGLTSFVDACNVPRIQVALRVHNSPHIPAYHRLQNVPDTSRAHQPPARAAARAPPPPSYVQTWMHQTIRAAARLGVKTSV